MQRGTRMLSLFATTVRSSCFVLLLAATPALAQQRTLAADEFVRQVLEQGLDARIAALEIEAAAAERAGAGRWPNPSIEWTRESFGDGTDESEDFFVASIPLVLSGRLGLERDAADGEVQAAKARYERARAALRRRATVAYFRVVEARQRVAVFERSLQEVRELERMLAARAAAGDAAGYDSLRMGVERATVENALGEARVRLAAATSEAERLLPPGRKLPVLDATLAPEAVPADRDELLAALESRRADLRALRLEAEAAEVLAAAAGRSWIPDPALSAGAKVQDLGSAEVETGYVVGLSVPLPFFERRQGTRALAEVRRRQAEARRAALLHAARSALAAAIETAASRAARVQGARDAMLEPARELQVSATAAYRAGGANVVTLVDAERTRREAELAFLDLALAARIAQTDLLFLAGAFDAAAGAP